MSPWIFWAVFPGRVEGELVKDLHLPKARLREALQHLLHGVGPLGEALGAAGVKSALGLEEVQLDIHLAAGVAAVLPHAVDVIHVVDVCLVAQNHLVLIQSIHIKEKVSPWIHKEGYFLKHPLELFPVFQMVQAVQGAQSRVHRAV